MHFQKFLYLSNMNFGRFDIYCNLQEIGRHKVVNLIKKIVVLFTKRNSELQHLDLFL
jgi:hypothetical protein